MPNEVASLQVEGMSCQHCVMSIKKAVGELNGVASVDVDLAAKQVTVNYNPTAVTVDAICETIEDQGYDIVK